MKRQARVALACLVPLFVPRLAHSESQTQLWTEVGLRHEIFSNVQLSLDQHVRFVTDPIGLDSVMPEIGVRWQPLSYVKVGAKYRYIYESDDDGYRSAHRFQLGGALRYKKGPLRVEYLLRVQERFREEKRTRTYRHRGRLLVAKLLPAEPFVGGELLTRVDDDGLYVDEWRAELGVCVQMSDQEMELLYRFERPVADDDDPVLHIISAGWNIEL